MWEEQAVSLWNETYAKYRRTEYGFSNKAQGFSVKEVDGHLNDVGGFKDKVEMYELSEKNVDGHLSK